MLVSDIVKKRLRRLSMNIVLLSCTKSKKDYTCPANEMYTESSLFKKAYEYATIIADKIFILSAKYGLLEEDAIIEPYELTLNNQKIAYRKKWAQDVLTSLNNQTSFENDNFIILTGERYYEFLIDSFTKFERPLKGKSMGHWIPTLQMLIRQCSERADAYSIHELFSNMPRYDYTKIRDVLFKNGIYIMFNSGEKYLDYDRIVRVGTHREQDNLKKRLRTHFNQMNQRSSIFRRNIGRIIVSERNSDYYTTWNSSRNDLRINREYEREIELEISEYLKNNITYTVFPVEEKKLRLRLEDGIISTLNHDPNFKAPEGWLGNKSPIMGIRNSGLWCVNGLNADVLSLHEFATIKNCIAGKEVQKNKYNETITKVKEQAYEKQNCIITGSNKTISKAERIRQHIQSEINEVRNNGESYIDLISGDIHKALGLSNNMPNVCRVMYKMNEDSQEILHTTQSEMSSTIKIRYFIKKRRSLKQ